MINTTRKIWRKLTQKQDARLPINIWGDVVLNGGIPKVRRVLTGMDAQECMYAWVYLNEIISLGEMAAKGTKPLASQTVLKDACDNFQALKAQSADPQQQITQEVLDIFLPYAFIFHKMGLDHLEFVELGSTFFAIIEKLEIAKKCANLDFDLTQLHFTGLEYSPFLQRGGRHLHPNHKIQYFKEWDEWQPSENKTSLHLSRFVASYSIKNSKTLTDWLAHFPVIQITDVFNDEHADFHTWDLGLPMTFLNFDQVFGDLYDKNYRVFVSDAHPDYHAAKKKKCVVARMFLIRKDLAERLEFAEFLSIPGHSLKRELDRNEIRHFIHETLSSPSENRWQKIIQYKEIYPIWGRVPEQVDLTLRRRLNTTGLNLVFKGQQIINEVKRANP